MDTNFAEQSLYKMSWLVKKNIIPVNISKKKKNQIYIKQ